MNTTIYTLDQAAQLLGFSRKTLQREINAGRYPLSFKVGKPSCTNSTDVQAYLAQQGKERDRAAEAKAAEAAAAVRFKREIEAWMRRPRLSDDWPGNTLIRTFSPNDPNRLP